MQNFEPAASVCACRDKSFEVAKEEERICTRSDVSPS